MNDNKISETVALLLRTIALGLALNSVYCSATDRMDDAIYSVLSAIFFELYNIEIKKR